MIYCNVDLYKNKKHYNLIKENYNDQGVDTYILNKFYSKGMGSVTSTLATLSMIKEYIRKGHPIDVIHAHSFSAGFIAALIKKIYKIPYIITEHHSKFIKKTLTKKDEIMAKIAFNQADKVVAVSEGLRNEMTAYYSGDIEVINNMVDSLFLNADLEKKKKSSSFTFFSCGYLTHVKGIDILINSMSILKEKNINCRLVIGGDGTDKNKLESQSIELGLQDRIEFKGSLSRENVVENLASCDAFVLPSRHETFGVAYIEALAMGRPIIMTNTGATNMIVDENNGMVVSKENHIELAHAMMKMIDNISFYNPEEIRNSCKQKFSENAVTTQLNSLYDSL